MSWVDGELEARLVPGKGSVYVLVLHRYTRFALAGKGLENDLFRALDLVYEEGFVSKFLSQVKAAQKAVAGEMAAVDPEFQRAYPAIWEFVSIFKQDDGTRRQTATLLAFVEAGYWKVCLGDRESGLSLWAAGETFQEALEALEACLQSPGPQWRQGAKRTPRKP